jgi:hypothetical protein
LEHEGDGENNIKIELKEMSCEDEKGMEVAQNHVH